MPVLFYPVEERPKWLDRAPVGGQLVFQPTRSVLSPHVALSPPVSGAAGLAEVDRFLITVRDPAGKWVGDDAQAPRRIGISYEGEPLRPVGFVWQYDDSTWLDQDELIEEWICCRRKRAEGLTGAAFFLDIDLWSLKELMTRASQQERNQRARATEEVTGALKNRVWYRAMGYSVELLRILNPNYFLEVERRLRALLDLHFSGDLDREVTACEQFAAGQLRQVCPPAAEGLLGFSAGDPDSANLFFFAEFAIAIVEIGVSGLISEEIAQFWRCRVNMFARMQAIYLKRWESRGPRRFAEYDSSAPQLLTVPEEVLCPYRAAGDDPRALDALIVGQIRKMTW